MCQPVRAASTVEVAPSSELHLVHRVLDLADHGVADALALVGLVAVHRRHGSGQDQGHQ